MKKHILVIDDESGVTDVLSAAFGAKGYRVTAASSGHEALRLVKQDTPDLIISDLQMEDADGLELISELKGIVPNAPVILLTGMIFDPDVIREVIGKKVSCYIEKTAPLQKITQEAQRLLGDLHQPAAA